MKNKKETRRITEEDVLIQTKWMIKNYYLRNIKEILPFFDPDFIWIDMWNCPYVNVKGVDAFIENGESPVWIKDEEYEILSHEGSLWVVCGYYLIISSGKNFSPVRTKIRNTYIWKEKKNQLFLLYIHSSDIQDISFFSDILPIKHLSPLSEATAKLCIKGIDGILYFLYPNEIHYIYSNKNIRYICTARTTISTKTSLNEFNQKLPDFIFVHRSYLTDIRRIYSLKRYEIQLLDGEILPVGKERYLNLQNQLKTWLNTE